MAFRPLFFLLFLHIALLSRFTSRTVADALIYCPIGSLPDLQWSTSVEVNETKTQYLSLTEKNSYYECPGPDDPKDYIECCPDPEPGCCQSSTPLTKSRPYNKGKELIYIFVASICLCVSALLLVCCFWSPCPFYNYNLYVRRYMRDDAGCADKMGEVPVFIDTLPAEDSPLGNTMVIAHSIKTSDGKGREVAV